MIPDLSTLLSAEQKRHCEEVAAITRFHAFMTKFGETGMIDGKPYKLKGISIPGNVASFEGEKDDYFFDGNKKPGHDDRDLELANSGLNGS